MAPGTEDQDLGLVSPRNHESFNDRTYRRDSDYHDAESLATPYDPPDTYNAGDIAMQKTDDPPDSATIISPMQGGKNGEYGFLNYNDTYDSSDTRSLLSTAKHYDHHESRKFLIKTGSYRLFMTILFSASMALCLKAYEGFSKPFIMSKVQVRVFNALMLALSLGLGLNLASSLKRYATILRWTLLTRRYVSLEVFDLILGLETLTKVGKLMFISLPGIRKVKMFRKLPWFRDARDDGTNLTWIACCLWLLINIGVQILVAALSLFWPIDPSDAIPLLTYGNVTVTDMVDWKAHVPGRKWDSNYTSMEAAWKYGMEAMQYPEFAIDDIKTDLSSLAGTPVYKGDGFYEYKFFNRNPVHQYTNYLLSTRTVQTRATCDQIETRGKRRIDVDGMYIEGRMGNDWYKYPLAEYAEGSLTWMGSNSEMCGPRCTNLTVYQDSDEGEIVNPGLFLCQSKVDPVQGGDKDFQNLSPEDRDHIYGTDGFARIAAGSIAWTGMEWDGWTDRQFRTYLRGSKWSPYRQMANKDVEDLLMRFTIGAIAAFDDHGVRYNVTKQHSQPIQGQQLQVEWPYIGGILGAIILIQFAALLCLIAFANKSIIRDDSSFSLAMLLSPVVNRIGPAGMNLSGEEIKRHPKLQWKRIRYDYREGKMGEPNKVDIFFQGKDNAESRRSWAPGVYA